LGTALLPLHDALPIFSAEEAPRLTPFVKLAEYLGSFAGQLTETAIKGIRIEFEGEVSALNTRPMVAAALNGVLTPLLGGNVNMVDRKSTRLNSSHVKI